MLTLPVTATALLVVNPNRIAPVFVASAALAWHIGSPGNPIRNAVNGSPTYRAKAGDALVAAMEHR